MPQPLRVLLVEDSSADAELLVEELRRAGFAPSWERVANEGAYHSALDRGPDLILADHSLPQFDSDRALSSLQERGLDIPFLIVSGTIDEERAVAAMTQGATDYLLKDRLARLGPAVTRALEQKRLREEKRRADQERARMADHLRLLLESTGEGICEIDPQGKLTFINRAGAQMLGSTPDELLGQDMHQRIHHSHADGSPYPREQCPIQRTFSSRKGCWVESEVFWDRTGIPFPVEYSSSPIMEGEAVSGVVVTFADISQRKHAEEAMSLLASMVESSEDAIIGGRLDGTITTWNPGAERLYGWMAREVVGRNLGLLVPPDHTEEAARILQRIRRGEGSALFETVGLRQDGLRVEIAVSVSPIRDAGGTVTGVSVIARDITERRHLEEQFRQAQKMEAVGRLAGGIAHDFNNLLTVITGFSEYLLTCLSPGDSAYTSIQEIKKAGERAADLTRQLLIFSRKQVIELKLLDLPAVVGDLEKMLRRVIGEDIDLVTVAKPPTGQVRADRGQVQQVIVNLAVNARDAMPRGGKLTIEIANVELDEAYMQTHPEVQPGPYVLLAMSDTGCGMDRATQARIFEPFFTTKEQGKGTGLGLATVYGIVKQSGGHIAVYSEPGQGTTFKLYFPRSRGTGRSAELRPGAGKGIPRGEETILLVEDEDGVRAMARMTLQMSGYKVLEASHASEAMLIASQRRGPIHVLVTDVVMPQISGRQLATELAPLRPEMKVLYLSGYTDDAVVRHGVLEAEMAFLQKPFTAEALAQKVRAVLDQKKKETRSNGIHQP